MQIITEKVQIYAEYIGKNAIYGMIFHISTIKNSHGIYKEILHEN